MQLFLKLHVRQINACVQARAFTWLIVYKSSRMNPTRFALRITLRIRFAYSQ